MLVFTVLLLSGWLVVSLSQQPEPINKSLAIITDIEGDVLILKNKDKSRMRAFKGLHIFKFDQLLVAENSFATLSFKTGHKVIFNESSEVNFKYWDNTNNSWPLYAHLRRGSYQEVKTGKKDMLVLESKNQAQKELYKNLPAQKLQNNLIAEAPPKGEVTPLAPSKSLLQGASLRPTNKEISGKVRSYLNQLQKCQLNSFGNSLQAKGQMTIMFSILPAGKTEKISVLSSKVNSSQLDACVKSVFSRMKFPKFEGHSIQVNFPLKFE